MVFRFASPMALAEACKTLRTSCADAVAATRHIIIAIRMTVRRLIWSSSLAARCANLRSEEHTSELQSHLNLVCRLLLEKKKTHSKYTVLKHRAMSCFPGSMTVWLRASISAAVPSPGSLDTTSLNYPNMDHYPFHTQPPT